MSDYNRYDFTIREADLLHPLPIPMIFSKKGLDIVIPIVYTGIT